MVKKKDSPHRVKLSDANRAQAARILTPAYDRADLKPGIVHIGLGNFHRAHQAWYLHRLMQVGLAHDWAIIGAGVRSIDEEQRFKLAAQGLLDHAHRIVPGGKPRRSRWIDDRLRPCSVRQWPFDCPDGRT